MTERWLPVVGYEGLYEVSNTGKVRSVDRHEPYLNRWGTETIRFRPSRTMRATIRNGYPEVGLTRRGKQKPMKIHRLVLEAFVGPCPEGMETRHLDGQRDHNVLANLAWGTKSENTYDRVRHGTDSKARRTCCPQGHPLKGANLDPSQQRDGRRSCWACKIARDEQRTAARRGTYLDVRQVAGERFAQLQAGWRPSPSATRTHCPRGHSLAVPNLRADSLRKGHRACAACKRAGAYASWLRRKKGAAVDVDVLADKYYEEILRKAVA